MWNNMGDFNQTGFGQGGGFGTPQADEKKRGPKRSNNIVPVTIAQILTAKHDGDFFVSENLELSQVTFIGLIKSVNEQATRIDFLIDDMTGPPIEVRQFSDSDADESDQTSNASSAFPVNSYVRVNGIIRTFSGKRTVNSHKMAAVTDMNELTCHMLEVIYTAASSQQQQSVMNNKTGATMMDTHDGGLIQGLTPLQSQIQMIIRSVQSDAGCSIDEVCQKMKSVAPKAIRDAIEFLSSEGHIYSTIDDEHFQATD